MHYQYIIKAAIVALPFINAAPVNTDIETRATLCYVNSKRAAEANPACAMKRFLLPDLEFREAHIDSLAERATLCYVNSKREASPACAMKREALPSPATLCYVNSKRAAEAMPACAMKRDLEFLD